MKRRIPLMIAAMSVAVCTSPARPCACEPTRGHIVVYGVVHTTADVAIPGATVFALVPMLGDPNPDPVLSPQHGTATSASDGSYRIEVFSPTVSQLPAAVLTEAVHAPAENVRQVAFGSLRSERETPDSVRLDFLFP